MKKRYKFVLIPLAVLTLLLVVSALVVDWHGKRTLERSIDAVVAEGGFRDFSGFARPELADDQNAATAWIEAAVLAWGEPDDDWNRELTAEQEALSKPQHTEIELLTTTIETQQEAVEKAWGAADRSAVHWPIDYNDPQSWIDSDYLGQTRQVGRLLAADTRVALSRGDYARAEQSLLAILALSDDASAPPILINTLVAISLDSLAMDVISNSDIHLKRDFPMVRDILESQQYESKLSRALLGEIPYGLAFIQSDDRETARLSRWPSRLLTQYDMAYYINAMSRISDAANKPFAEANARLSQINDSPGFPYLISQIIMPATGATIRTARTVSAKRDLLLLNDEIVEISASESASSWASRLELPDDPLTGLPFRLWLAENGGFVLWSIAAENPAHGKRRFELVCQTGTEALPPELETFRQEWEDFSPRAQRPVE
ncbi:MAG: hypothetical protein AAGA25_05885 [Planctomycetota bacterium]